MEIPFNLLILPFLGGYIFVRFWNYTRIHTLRSDKDRMVIRSALAGLFALGVAYAISLFIPFIPCSWTYMPCYYDWWKANFPLEYLGVSVGAFLIAGLGWIPLNWLPFFHRERQIDRAIEEDADPMELLLKAAQDNGDSLAFTLINEKVYIGFVIHKFNPATPTNSVGITPLASGYRDPETKQLHLKIDYAAAFEKMTQKLDNLSAKIVPKLELLEKARDRKKTRLAIRLATEVKDLQEEWDEVEFAINSFVITIPVRQIASVHIHDNDVYEEYFRPRPIPELDSIN